MKKQYSTTLSTIKNVVLSVLFLACFVLDCWCGYIHFWGKEKVNSYIFKVGAQTATAVDPETGEETTDSRWFAEVNIYDNCYEIMFNYFKDDTRTEFYSQGLQFYLVDDKNDLKTRLNQNYHYYNEANPETGKISKELSLYYDKQTTTRREKEDWTKTISETKGLIFGTLLGGNYEEYAKHYTVCTEKSYPGLEVSNFASGNEYGDTIYSSNPLNEDSYFLIEIGEESYLMQMRGSDLNFLTKNDDFFLTQTAEHVGNGQNWLGTIKRKYFNDTSYYRSCDIYYLAEVIYNSCLGLNYSSTGIVIDFEFGDLFNYYTDSKQVINDNNICDKVKNYVSSYYQIRVQKHQGNMTSSTQSLFNNFKGSNNYDEESAENAESESEVFTDYHHGKTILDIDENFFKVNISKISGTYKMYLSLDKNFKSQYPADSGYRLRVTINLDNIAFSNVEFAGLVTDTLDGYYVYQVLTKSTSSGELIIQDITQEVV